MVLAKNDKTIVVISCHTPSLRWFRMDMMRQFRKKGYRVFALGNEGEEIWRERFENEGIVYHAIPVRRNGVNPIYDVKTFFAIWKWLQRIHPRKIFVYQAKTIIYTGIVARCLRIKEVYPMISGVGSLFLTDSIKTNVIRKVMMYGYRLSFKTAKIVFFQNKEDYRLFREKRIISLKQQIQFIPGSGVNLEKFSVYSLPKETVFVCISRLIRDKGIFEYLKACEILKSKYPDVKCILIGPFDSNPYSLRPQQLRPYIKKRVIKYYAECDDVRPYLRQSSVFVLPSYREGTPKAVLEAMACGRAIITTDAPGCRETVIDGENGYLVPVRNVDAIVEKMKIFIKHPEIIKKMGENGRLIAEKKFDVNIVNQIICEAMHL